MKNLKRALSLVLSTAMLLGMMVVGTGAAHSDVTAEHNEEAIAVVSAAGIMGANETFNPDANITRNEMAVVMVNMLDLDTDAFAGACPYTEAAWAQSYVDAVYAKGIMSGDGTSFNGGANVTLVEAALMMMKALGYFQTAGDFEGGWDTATILKAAEIDLLDGVNAKSYDKLTRNQVAQLALNALETPTVNVKNSSNTTTSITAGEVKVEITGKNTYTENTNKVYYNGDKDDEFEYLIETLFEDIEKKTDATNAMGLPGTKWTNDGDKIIFVADEADEIVIAEEDTDAFALYLDEVDDDYDEADINDDAVCAGDVVYYYENDEGDVTAYVAHYDLVQIGEIDDEVRRADAEDGVKAYVEVLDEVNGDNTFNDDDFAGFDYEEDDYVLVCYEYNKKGEIVSIADSAKAEIVEGKITGSRGGDEYKIGGKYYTDLTKDAKLVKNAEVEVILNMAGQIILVDNATTATSEDFIYIYNYKVEDKDSINDEGVTVKAGEMTVWGILADGSKVKYVVEEDSAAKIDTESIDADKMVVVPYSIDDGELVVEDSDLSVKYASGADVDLDKNNDEVKGLYANSKTEFVFVKEDDSKMVVTTATGVKNVNIEKESIAVIYDKDDEDMLIVFVAAKAAALESDAEYAVLVDTDGEDYDDDDTIYSYIVLINGKETTLQTKNEELTDEAVMGAPFAYEMDGDYVDVDTVVALTDVMTVTRVGEDFVVVTDGKDSFRYDLADGEDYTLTYVFEDDADADTEDYEYVETVNMSTSANLKKDAKVIIDANSDDEIEVLFIVKASR